MSRRSPWHWPTTTGVLAAIEHRVAPRSQLLQRCWVQAVDTPAAAPWPSIAYDLSRTGIGLTLPCSPKVGMCVAITPWELPGARPLRARIVHARPVEDFWFCGCELDEHLSEKEFQAWQLGGWDWLPREELS